MEIKLVITIDDKLEAILKRVLSALTHKDVLEMPKGEARPKTRKELKSSPQATETAKNEPKEDFIPEPETPSVPFEDILPEKPVSVVDVRIAVNKARERGVDMDKVKDLILNRYQVKNVSSIPESQRALFIADLEAL